MNDNYGNYFCQKFYKLLELNDKIGFLNRVNILTHLKLTNSILFIGNDKIGTHALQHIICALCNKKEKEILISFIEDSFEKLANDKLGVHVIEKLILCYDEDFLKTIYGYIFANFTEYANDSNTLCLVRIYKLNSR